MSSVERQLYHDTITNKTAISELRNEVDRLREVVTNELAVIGQLKTSLEKSGGIAPGATDATLQGIGQQLQLIKGDMADRGSPMNAQTSDADIMALKQKVAELDAKFVAPMPSAMGAQ